MSTYSTRQAVKDQGAKANEADNEVSMAAIASLLEEHRQAPSADFKTFISTLEAKLDLVHTTVSDHAQKIIALEANATLQYERLIALEALCAVLTESNAKLTAKVSDLESRSRRNDIRVVGIPVSVEGPWPTAFFAELLMEVFREGFSESLPECYRAHCTLTEKPKPGQRALPVIIRLHRYQVKERIIHEARARRGKLQYRGSPISIYEDYAPDVVERRQKYRDVMSKLYNLGFKPALLFPARLIIVMKDGGRKRLASVSEAKDFISSTREEET